jgi:hypothetical protein
MSTDRESQPPPQRLAEKDVRRVLQRAIELDALRGNEITVEELKRVAAELNISSESVTRALAELAEPPSTPKRGKWRDYLKAGIRAAGIAIVSFIVGNVTGQNDVMSFWLFVITALAALRYRGRSEGEYFRDVIALCASFGFGWFLKEGIPTTTVSDAQWHLVMPGLLGMGVGWLLLHLKWSWRRSEPKNSEPKQSFSATT